MAQALPLEGIRVIEFCHVVMGPACGLVLADMGAEVIKVEPLDGDHTRKLTASGAGFFPTYNRNKKSFAVDLKSPQGHEAVMKLIASADVVIENFRPGAMDNLGFGQAAMRKMKPALIYCSLKGFLPGPYLYCVIKYGILPTSSYILGDLSWQKDWKHALNATPRR